MTSVKQAGADPDAADDSGAKPIAAAAAAGEREVVEALFPLTTQPADGVCRLVGDRPHGRRRVRRRRR